MSTLKMKLIKKMIHRKNITIESIPIEITQKKMKNMYIRADRDLMLIKISVPYHVSFAKATEFAYNNLDWIKSTYNDLCSHQICQPKEYINGEQLMLWGKAYDIIFTPSYCDKGVYIKDNKAILYAPLDSDSQLRKKIIDSWYRDELSAAIDSLADECTSITKKAPNEWRIKDMKTKWGTCNYRDYRIWISLGLARKPIECLKYVMIHELTHLYVPNHGPEFKAYMDMFCPNWRELKKLLNS